MRVGKSEAALRHPQADGALSDVRPASGSFQVRRGC
jgi:hypothetical protein